MAVARNILKNPKLLPGGGATELTVSASLKQKSSSVEGIEKVMYHITILHKTGAVELKMALRPTYTSATQNMSNILCS